MNRGQSRTWWLVALVLLAPGTVRADNVARELGALAEEVAQVLGKQDRSSLRMGRFVGAGDIPSHAGPEITRILMSELSKRKITVEPRAPIELKGEYRPVDQDPGQPASKELFIRIVAELVDTKSGLPLGNVTLTARAVYGNAEAARIFAVPTSLSPDASREKRNEQIKKDLETPQMARQQSVIRSKAGSPFGVEILVVKDPKLPDPAGRPATLENGLAYVAITRGEFYRVKFTNSASFDVAIRLSIDGLDQFVFSDEEFKDRTTGKSRFNYRLVPAGKSIVIAGWFRNLKQFDYFVLTEYARSAVAELKAPVDEIGQIVVQVHAVWEKDENKPRDEGYDRSLDATGRQAGGTSDLQVVTRQIGVLRDTVPVRYNRR